uniref:Uncharacterized protein n=1 Tax=Klebsiella pneumoniae TaxID=573 RepID=A0A8E6L711_KLEPN|nr:hypothetical protein [Klebsiella pneumoniae]
MWVTSSAIAPPGTLKASRTIEENRDFMKVFSLFRYSEGGHERRSRLQCVQL